MGWARHGLGPCGAQRPSGPPPRARLASRCAPPPATGDRPRPHRVRPRPAEPARRCVPGRPPARGRAPHAHRRGRRAGALRRTAVRARPRSHHVGRGVPRRARPAARLPPSSPGTAHRRPLAGRVARARGGALRGRGARGLHRRRRGPAGARPRGHPARVAWPRRRGAGTPAAGHRSGGLGPLPGRPDLGRRAGGRGRQPGRGAGRFGHDDGRSGAAAHPEHARTPGGDAHPWRGACAACCGSRRPVWRWAR